MAKRQHISTCPIVIKIVERLVALGWHLWRGAKHKRMVSPDGKVALTVIRKPSDRRASLNWVSQLRRTEGVPAQVLEGL